MPNWTEENLVDTFKREGAMPSKAQIEAAVDLTNHMSTWQSQVIERGSEAITQAVVSVLEVGQSQKEEHTFSPLGQLHRISASSESAEGLPSDDDTR